MGKITERDNGRKMFAAEALMAVRAHKYGFVSLAHVSPSPYEYGFLQLHMCPLPPTNMVSPSWHTCSLPPPPALTLPCRCHPLPLLNRPASPSLDSLFSAWLGLLPGAEQMGPNLLQPRSIILTTCPNHTPRWHAGQSFIF